MNQKYLRIVVSALLFTMTTGCTLLSQPNPLDRNIISTQAAQTVIAGLTQAAPPTTLSPTLPGATLTFSPEPPTFTPTQTLTATEAFTPTSVNPQISVSVPTNCRNGPGKVYVRVGALLVGETAQVYGRDPTSRYWYIPNPDRSGEFCWVWGEYATLNGNSAFLPVYTPPPTPTPTFTPKPTFTLTPSPDFEASYSSLDTCVGWWVEIKLKNNGSIPFKSMGITIKDTVTDIVLANFVDGFTNIDGCLSTTTRDTLGVGKTHVISAPAFNYDPSGHKLRATIILCSDIGQSGTCVTNTIIFTP